MMYYCGENLEDMTKEQLIAIISEMAQMQEQERKYNLDRLKFLLS